MVHLVTCWFGIPPRAAGCRCLCVATCSSTAGIWHLVERVRVLRPVIGGGPALAGVILDPLLIVAASVFVVVAGGWQQGLALLAPCPALLMIPRWREPLLRRLERSKAAQLQSAGSGPLESVGRGRGGYPWRPSPFSCCLCFAALPGSGAACRPGMGRPAFTWLAAFGLAYAVGLVVPGAPGGLGVFEATLLLRLGAAVPEAQLLAVVLSYRLLSTLADVAASGALVADRWVEQRVKRSC